VSGGELEAYRDALGDRLEVVVVPGGHLLLWDAFDETAAAVEEFLG
jgi:surfactin synthase thioesterase subunit